MSLLEVPGVPDRPALSSTFLSWLLADLLNDLPEAGDLDKPKLVFFFNEAHLLFGTSVCWQRTAPTVASDRRTLWCHERYAANG
nr:hypothetical protein BJQ95_03569 [Cryobacterium sp. SO1]